MADEIVPLLFLGNITDATNWKGAVVPCLFDEGELREEALSALLERIHRYRGDGVERYFKLKQRICNGDVDAK